MADKVRAKIKMKIKSGDKVIITTGKDKNKEGKILLVDRKRGKVIVEGLNMVTKHQKAAGPGKEAGIIKREALIDASNVAFLHKGKPTKIGYKLESKEVNGKMVTIKSRVAKTTGEIID